MKKLLLFIFIISLVISFSCKKQDTNLNGETTPKAPVDLYYNPGTTAKFPSGIQWAPISFPGFGEYSSTVGFFFSSLNDSILLIDTWAFDFDPHFDSYHQKYEKHCKYNIKQFSQNNRALTDQNVTIDLCLTKYKAIAISFYAENHPEHRMGGMIKCP